MLGGSGVYLPDAHIKVLDLLHDQTKQVRARPVGPVGHIRQLHIATRPAMI